MTARTAAEWSDHETQMVARAYLNGEPYESIARFHQRTMEEVRRKVDHLKIIGLVGPTHRQRTPTGLVLGGAYTPKPPTPAEDAIVVQAAVLGARRPLWRRILGLFKARF